uniref:Integrase catalytic domain-containing protein n=1 Tax=Bracon brevicornis TaxID=1563983 RepID=A0A6V7KPR9_9HYME
MRIRHFGDPWSVICADVMGPYPETPRGNRFVIVIEDTMTRYVEATPTSESTAEVISECLRHAILRWANPKVLHTDNGLNFLAEPVRRLCRDNNIAHTTTPPYWPQANPVERANRVIKTLLKIYLDRDHTEWDIHIADIVYAYNTAPHSSLGNISPAYLNFGRELKPPKYMRGRINPQPEELRPIEGDWRARVANMQVLRGRVSQLVVGASEKPKFHYDKKHRDVLFNQGDRVLKRNKTRTEWVGNRTVRFAPTFAGPFTITRVVSPVVVELEDLNGRNAGRFHVSHLKKYFKNPIYHAN